jgi:hypothetical protein
MRRWRPGSAEQRPFHSRSAGFRDTRVEHLAGPDWW